MRTGVKMGGRQVLVHRWRERHNPESRPHREGAAKFIRGDATSPSEGAAKFMRGDATSPSEGAAKFMRGDAFPASYERPQPTRSTLLPGAALQT